MLTVDDIRIALRDCYDPQLPCNLVDLGTISALTVRPDEHAPGAGIPGVPQRFLVQIELAPTAPDNDVAVAQTLAQIRNRLAGLEAVSRLELGLDTAHLWSPAHITPAGRRLLGLDGNHNLVQIR